MVNRKKTTVLLALIVLVLTILPKPTETKGARICKRCGNGLLNTTYCEDPRCPCTVADSECASDHTCQCIAGKTEVDGMCEPECGDGSLNTRYCEDPRCPCTVTGSECVSDHTCQCIAGKIEVDGMCVPECGNGLLNTTYCEDSRCPCTVSSSECATDHTCQCIAIRTEFEGMCVPVYTLYESASKTWAEAEPFCEQQGGKLAMFKNKQEVTAFGNFVETLTTVVYYWIGAAETGDGQYSFIDGTSVNDLFGSVDAAFLTEDSLVYWSDTHSFDGSDLRCFSVYNGYSYPAATDYKPCTDTLGVICQDVVAA